MGRHPVSILNAAAFLRAKGARLNQNATAAVRQAGGCPTALSRRYELEARLAFAWADELDGLRQDEKGRLVNNEPLKCS